ncbi:MAG TPA: hypothetical protein VNN20_03725 [Thermodesulfobacteriota bacterium]|nr:hypothetical protein [Thermodesulfobacteriota bacterium]
MDLKARRVSKVHKGRRERLGLKVLREKPARKDLRDCRAKSDLKVR